MSKKTGGVAAATLRIFLRNLTKSQSKIRDCSRNRVLKPSHDMGDFFAEQFTNEDGGDAELMVAKSSVKSKAEEDEGQLTVDVYQNGDEIVIKSTIAGVTADDLDISVTNEMVTIKGSRKSDEKVKDSDFYYQELYWGPFSRAIILPEEVDADNSRASMKNGVLTIRLPKLARNITKKVRVAS